MRKIHLFLALAVGISCSTAFGQPKDYNSADIQRRLEKLNVLGTVLYLAAHPDDENTNVITYFSKDRLFYSAYLSLTRGDGGQNSIGPEITEDLGMIRTQELLAARRIDGGQQFFTRAIDFGYSKGADETFGIWDREMLLSDVVYVIRKWKPDVIITRFPPDRRAGHGQHEASAILGMDAMDVSGDKSKFSEHKLDPWQPKRILVNTGRWWRTDISADDPGVSFVDVGAYSSLLGKSYNEIAALARSQHKSQSFGVSSRRGESIEYLEHAKGIEAADDPFEDIDVSWDRVKGSKGLEKTVNGIIEKFDPVNPSDIVPDLFDLREKVGKLSNEFWKERKLDEIDYLIQACTGLFLEARAATRVNSPGDEVIVNFEMINRSTSNIKVVGISSEALQIDSTLNTTLENNKGLSFKSFTTLSEGVDYSDPYWLAEEHGIAHYSIKDASMTGKPQNDPAVTVNAQLEIDGNRFNTSFPLVYRYTDHIKGEVYEPFVIGPEIYVSLDDQIYIFPNEKVQQVSVTLQSSNGEKSGTLRLEVPEGWTYEPKSIEFQLNGEEQKFNFNLKANVPNGDGSITAIATSNNKTFNQGVSTIEYPHIPLQTKFPKATAKVRRFELEKEGRNIGYIMGAGDGVAKSLQQMGYNVTLLNYEDLEKSKLRAYDAIVVGVMAYNVDDQLGKYNEVLLDYIYNGGNIFVQYTNGRVSQKSEMLMPFEIKLTRNSARSRVSVEDAEIRLLAPDHPALNGPNNITQKDFDGWVQERGLYFPVAWDKKYTALFSSNDPGEEPLDGGLLVAPYGSGYYVYSSYSWFRQLPEGVPGACRIFANLLSLGNENETPIPYGHDPQGE